MGFNHFFRNRNGSHEGDLLFVQGHAAPGIYARAFLEGRISEEQLKHFRHEVTPPGLSSYPHPWLMPDFWEFPTVSMGLGAITGIYQARFMKYLENRGIKKPSDSKVWVMMGDGEMDEPESLGANHRAGPGAARQPHFRDQLQPAAARRSGPGQPQDHPGAGGHLPGRGWNVIKCIWGSDWDPLLEKDGDGLLVNRMHETVDGQYQKYSMASGEYIRNKFFGIHPDLKKMVEHLSDSQLQHCGAEDTIP